SSSTESTESGVPTGSRFRAETLKSGLPSSDFSELREACSIEERPTCQSFSTGSMICLQQHVDWSGRRHCHLQAFGLGCGQVRLRMRQAPLAAAARSWKHSVGSPAAIKAFQKLIRPSCCWPFASAAILALAPRPYYHLTITHERNLITPSSPRRRKCP